MNILFFLIPKSEVAYIFEDETLRQTLEKMEHRKYSCIPILTMDGKYLGTISEGDLLWGMRRADIHDIKETEGVPIMAIPRRATYKPVWKISWIAPSIRTSCRLWMTRAPLSES